MMSSAFLAVLNASLSASIAAVAVLLLRVPLRRAPKAFSVALWAIVGFRLLCLIPIENAASVLPANIAGAPRHWFEAITSAWGGGEADGATAQDAQAREPVGASINPAGDPADASAIPAVGSDGASPAQARASTATPEPARPVPAIVAIAWSLGIAAMLAHALIGYLRLRHRLRDATRVEPGVYQTDRIASPFVLGMLRPCIYIPSGLPPEPRAVILAHERMHIRRGDHIALPIAYLALSLHWFNPIVWASYRLLCRDIELACDEAVLRHAAGDIRASYSSSLLALSARRSGLYQPLAFGENDVKRRVRHALSFRRPATWVLIASVAAVCASAVLFTGNRAAPQEGIVQAVGSYDLDALYARRTSLDVGNPDASIADIARIVDLLPLPHRLLGGVAVRTAQDDPREVVLEYRYAAADAEPVRFGIAMPTAIDFQRICRRNALVVMGLVDDLDKVAVVVTLPSWQNPLIDMTERFAVTRASLARFGDLAALWEGDRAELQAAMSALLKPSQPLTMDDVRALAAKGDALSMDDVMGFQGHDASSTGDRHTLVFGVEDSFRLVVAARKGEQPYTASLEHVEASSGIDIRRGDIDAFLAQYPSASGKWEATPGASPMATPSDTTVATPSPSPAATSSDMPMATPSPSPMSTSSDAPSGTAFTQQEIADARAVVEAYYQSMVDMDAAAMQATLSSARGPVGEMNDTVTITLDRIAPFDPNDQIRRGYMKSGHGRTNGVALEDVIVFKVDFTVTYEGEATAAWEEGPYTDFNMILIREGAGAPWRIDDMGY